MAASVDNPLFSVRRRGPEEVVLSPKDPSMKNGHSSYRITPGPPKRRCGPGDDHRV